MLMSGFAAAGPAGQVYLLLKMTVPAENMAVLFSFRGMLH
jgi:hypothetical protein